MLSPRHLSSFRRALVASLCLVATVASAPACDGPGSDSSLGEVVATRLALTGPATSGATPVFRTLRFGFAEDRLPDIYRRASQQFLYREMITEHLAPLGLNTLYFTRVFTPELDITRSFTIEDDLIVAIIDRFADDYGTALNIGLADLPVRNFQVAPPNLTLPAFYASEGVSLSDLFAQMRNRFPPTFAHFDAADLSDYVSDLYAHLGPTARQTVTFETGNEPEALQFFWGEAGDYRLKADALHAGLRRGSGPDGRLRRPYAGPIYYGGFTSAAMVDLPPVLNAAGVDITAAAKDNQRAFFDTIATYNHQADPAYPLAFHVFRQLGYGTSGNFDGVQEKRFDAITSKVQAEGLDLTGSSVSSYSLFGKVGRAPSDWKVDLINSDFYVYDLAREVLIFTYAHDIAEFYFWKLFHQDDEDDHRGMFVVDEDAANAADIVQPTGRFESVALVWELIAEGYRVEAHGDYTEITGLDTTGRTIKKLIVTANKHSSPILVEADWDILRQSHLQGTESWIGTMNNWYQTVIGASSVVPNTDFAWVRYDIEVVAPPMTCSVAVIEPHQGLMAAPGGVLELVWDLDGYDDGEVYLSVFSGWSPAHYYFHDVVDNDGHHAWPVPANLDPSLDYTVYVESVVDGARSGHCWQYASLDVLPFAWLAGP